MIHLKTMVVVQVILFLSFLFLRVAPTVLPLSSNPLALGGNLNPVEIVRKTAQRWIDGTTGMYSNFREAERLKKIKKKHGERALSFSQFKFLEKASDDFQKMLKLGILLPISPQFFFYSNVLTPMIMSSWGSSPWTYRAFPSSFDNEPIDLLRRSQILRLRRVHAFFKTVLNIQHASVEDGSAESHEIKRKQLQKLVDCLKNPVSLEASLKVLQSWYDEEPNKSKNSKGKPKSLSNSKLGLKLSHLPPSFPTDCCKALDLDVLPDIPLIRRLNIGTLSKYCKMVKINNLTLPYDCFILLFYCF
jgi:hypothetical protein